MCISIMRISIMQLYQNTCSVVKTRVTSFRGHTPNYDLATCPHISSPKNHAYLPPTTTYLLLCIPCGLDGKMDVLHGPLYHTHSVRPLCLRVDALVGNDGCYVTVH